MELPTELISDFPNHSFKVRENEETLDRYRRKRANGLVGQKTLLYIIWNLTNNEATIITVNSNLQWERILPSKKA